MTTSARLALVLSASGLALVGCDGSDAATTDGGPDAAECVPAVRVCVTDELGALAPGATVTATRAGEIPHEDTTGADGCAALYPEAGTWELRARTDRNCVSEPRAHTVTGCGTTDVTLAATSCLDG